ncbi:unnamed protein product [Symbiodinium sp. CCMP2592]|nr:unnamed protein product [Symbiodinium sp. CCMP2592]
MKRPGVMEEPSPKTSRHNMQASQNVAEASAASGSKNAAEASAASGSTNEAEVQASQWDVPPQRPSWARVGDGAPVKPGAVEVAQLHEDRWICTMDIDLNSSVDSMLQELKSTGCARGFRYEVVGVAVSVKEVPETATAMATVEAVEADRRSS